MYRSSSLEAAQDMPFYVQTVPSCQTLYKNSFEYHTVVAAPPDFDECCGFIGQPSGLPSLVSSHLHRPHCNARNSAGCPASHSR